MRKLFLIVLLILFVAGCATVDNGNIKDEGDRIREEIEEEKTEPNDPHPRDWGLE